MALGVPEMASDERFKNFATRHKNREATVAAVQNILLTKRTSEWLQLLRGKVPCAPVNDLSQALSDPFLQERGMIVETQHPVFGKVKQVAGPFKVSDAEVCHHRAPTMGEHTAQVLMEYLGYDKEEVAALSKKRVV